MALFDNFRSTLASDFLREKDARKQQRASQRMLAGLNIDDPASLQAAAERAVRNGNLSEAMQLSNRARALRESAAAKSASLQPVSANAAVQRQAAMQQVNANIADVVGRLRAANLPEAADAVASRDMTPAEGRRLLVQQRALQEEDTPEEDAEAQTKASQAELIRSFAAQATSPEAQRAIERQAKAVERGRGFDGAISAVEKVLAKTGDRDSVGVFPSKARANEVAENIAKMFPDAKIPEELKMSIAVKALNDQKNNPNKSLTEIYKDAIESHPGVKTKSGMFDAFTGRDRDRMRPAFPEADKEGTSLLDQYAPVN